MEGLAHTVLRSTGSGAIPLDHLSECGDTAVFSLTHVPVALTLGALLGAVRALVLKVTLHLNAADLSQLAGVTGGELLETSLAVTGFVGGFEWGSATAVRALRHSVATALEQVLREIKVRDLPQVAVFIRAAEGGSLEKLHADWMHRLEVCER